MARTLTSAATPLLIGCVCVGCVDFVDPGLGRVNNPSIVVGLELDSDSLRVNALLLPRWDEFGRRRLVSSETLRIDGRDILPQQEDRDGELRLTYRSVRPRSPADAVAVEAMPSIDGFPSAPPVFFATISRSGSDTIAVGRGEPLVLHIRQPPRVTEPAPTGRFWTMTGAGDDGSFSASGRGALPDSITISPEFVPDGGSFEITLLYQEQVSPEDEQGYLWAAALRTQIAWAGRIVQ